MKTNLFQEALTFDDILLKPGHSKVLPSDVSTTTKLTKKITLNIPILSAAMDTVTESKTAITMAQNGGLGIIHKNLSIEQQIDEVRKVKRHETGMVVDPITLSPDDNIEKALRIKSEEHISGFPVVDRKGTLVGIVTNRDLRFERNLKKKISAVMTKDNLITVRDNVTQDQARNLLQKHRIEKLLVVEKNKKLKGLITVRDLENTKQYPLSLHDNFSRLMVGAATGVGDSGIERLHALVEAETDVIIVDTAHGHSQMVLDTVKKAKQIYKNKVQIIAGNIATKDAAKALINAGVDGLKVGVGPGSICTTRIVSGVGVPQVYALQECLSVAQKAGVPVISDGGIKYSGDVAKALALGANTVMIGSLLAGTDESPGEIILYQGRSYKVYRGMGSLGAMARGSKDRYFQAEVHEARKLVPEGIEGRVPYRGPLADSLYQLVGGLRSGMGYVGAKSLPEFQKKAQFVRITSAGLKESHVHDIIVTKEAPNYRID